MNVIYRRLWSTARKCWVVASEIAVVRGRASHTLGVVTMTGLLAAMPALHAAETEDEEERQLQLRDLRRVAEPLALPSLFSSALAATSAPAATYRQLAVVTDYHYVDASVSGEEQLVLGSRTGIHGSKSVVYGNVAYANGTHNTALGYSSKAYGGYATAVGAVAIADGIGTIALGNYANAYDENSIAIGSGSLTVKGAGISRIAIGGNARAGTNGWTGAIALGGESQADQDAVAVGYGAKATRDGALAIGRGAASTEAGALALGKDSVASESYTVSVGNASRKRRIVNVEDARLGTTSTDAVTGKQLHSTNQSVATATSTATAAKTAADQALINSRIVTQASTFGEIRVGGENTGSTLSINNKSGAARYLNGVRNGALNTTSTDAVTGQQLYATNQNVLAARVVADAAAGRMSSANVALGQSAVAEGAAGTASASLGAAARAYNTQSVALGADARAAVDASGSKSEAIGAVALGAASRSGNGAVAAGLRAIATGDRAVAIGNDASARFTHATAVGYRAAAGANQATAVGREASASGTYASAVGNLAKATADSAVALGDRASASHAGSIALGNGSQTTAANQVSVGSASLKRRIVNVADAILSAGSTDAVTGSQLHTTNANVASARGAAEAAQRTADAVKLSAEEALTRTDALGGLIGQVAGNGNLRLGAENTGNVLDVRNKAGAGRKVTGLIDGVLRTDSTDAVNGKQLHATNGGVAAAQSSADSALGKVGILEGLLGQVAADGTLRLGAQNTGATLDMRNGNNGTRRLTGLSDGALGGSSTEAVTGRQLHATNQLVDIQGQALLVHGQTLAAHGQQMVLQDGRIAENRTDLDALRLAFEDFDPDLEGVVRFSEDGSVDLGGGKVRGLARGDISSASSMEAVNGGQLFETNARLAAVEGAGKFVSVGGGGDQSGSMAGLGAVAIGDSARASVDAEGAVALGAYAAALAKNSVSLGRAAHVTADATDGFALGVGTAVRQAGGVALGAESVVNDTAVSSLALGYGSQATESHTASFGNDGVRRRLVNVARGTAAFDVVTVAQLGEAIDVLGGGAGLDARGQVTAPSYDIQGSVRHNVGEALSALDSATTTVTAQVSNMEIQLRSIFSDVPTARSDGTPQLTLAGANGMVLSNVANGLIAAGSRDAVNGGQLHAVQQQLNGRMDGLEQRVDGQPQASAPLAAHRMAATDEAGAEEAAPSSPLQVAGTTDAPTPQSPAAPAPRADAPEDVKPQVDTADLERMLARANDYADGISREVDARLNKMDKRFNRMAAMSSAQSAMAMNTAGLATYNRLGAGVGYSDGESAMAVGYQRVLNEKGSATFSLNGAFTNSGERSVGVGVGIGW